MNSAGEQDERKTTAADHEDWKSGGGGGSGGWRAVGEEGEEEEAEEVVVAKVRMVSHVSPCRCVLLLADLILSILLGEDQNQQGINLNPEYIYN